MMNSQAVLVQQDVVRDSHKRHAANPNKISTVFGLVVDRLAFGVAILDEDLKVSYLNHAAAQLLVQSGVLALGQDERLTSTMSQVHKKLKDFISRVCLTGRSAVVAIPVCSTGSNMTLFITHGGLMAGEAGSSRFHAIMYLFDSQNMSTDMQAVLADAYRLTPAESKVALRLAQGLTLKALAEDLRISIGTARMHLKHVFKKVGVRSQADLIRKIVMGPVACLLSDNQASRAAALQDRMTALS